MRCGCCCDLSSMTLSIEKALKMIALPMVQIGTFEIGNKKRVSLKYQVSRVLPFFGWRHMLGNLVPEQFDLLRAKNFPTLLELEGFFSFTPKLLQSFLTEHVSREWMVSWNFTCQFAEPWFFCLKKGIETKGLKAWQLILAADISKDTTAYKFKLLGCWVLDVGTLETHSIQKDPWTAISPKPSLFWIVLHSC